MKNLIFLLLVIFSLAGCSATTQQTSSNSFRDFGKPLGNHFLPKKQRQEQLVALQNWTVRGNIAMHTEQKGWNASFNWQQQGANYYLTIFGPFGSSAARLTGNPQQVTLQTSNQTFTANSAEVLLQQQLGWSMPISNLYYWLRGMAAPNIKSRQAFDLNNHLVQLYQQDWHIIYLRYIVVNGIDVPNRILISNPHLQARVILTEWDF